jgi:hypothetical protein
MTLDSTAQIGTLRVQAHDADGPVHVTCIGAFPGEGDDSLTLIRTFAELHTFVFVITVCTGSEAADTTSMIFEVPDQYAINRPPQVDPLTGPSDLHVGVPTDWTVHITDDWGLSEYYVSVWYSPPGEDCVLSQNRIGVYLASWAVPGRTLVDTTVTITFPVAGPYCAGVIAFDDVGNGVGNGGAPVVAP